MLPASDLPLPPPALRFMHDQADAHLIKSGTQLANLVRRFGMSEDDRLLDVGSGYGRLAIGLVHTGFRGQYLGFDILPKQTRWCAENLTPATDGRYRFEHLNARNGRYNPRGTISPVDLEFPAEDASQDTVTVFSVFTHMYEADIRRYLREIARVLAPGGRALTTWFVYDVARLPRVLDPERAKFPMVNEINAVTRYNEPKDPLRAIAYHEPYVRTMVDEAGLAIEQIQLGNWCGDSSPDVQDVYVLTRPGVDEAADDRAPA